MGLMRINRECFVSIFLDAASGQQVIKKGVARGKPVPEAIGLPGSQGERQEKARNGKHRTVPEGEQLETVRNGEQTSCGQGRGVWAKGPRKAMPGHGLARLQVQKRWWRH